jgi:AraC-like DNA-binding protein
MSCHCKEKVHIKETLEKYYLCTHLPIQAYSLDGELIHAAGYPHGGREIIEALNVFEAAKDKLTHQDNDREILLSYPRDISFIAVRICSRSISKGIHIIGPFSVVPNNAMRLPHKPACCLPHLVTLLKNIAADSPFIRQKKAMAEQPCSLYVKKALDIMNSGYNEEITLCSIAKQLNINKCYFAAIFKKETGKTFTQALNELRIERSKPMLTDGKSSILEVALSVGYNNQNYYNMTFKKLTGKTPLEYRRSAIPS